MIALWVKSAGKLSRIIGIQFFADLRTILKLGLDNVLVACYSGAKIMLVKLFELFLLMITIGA